MRSTTILLCATVATGLLAGVSAFPVACSTTPLPVPTLEVGDWWVMAFARKNVFAEDNSYQQMPQCWRYEVTGITSMAEVPCYEIRASIAGEVRDRTRTHYVAVENFALVAVDRSEWRARSDARGPRIIPPESRSPHLTTFSALDGSPPLLPMFGGAATVHGSPLKRHQESWTLNGIQATLLAGYPAVQLITDATEFSSWIASSLVPTPKGSIGLWIVWGGSEPPESKAATRQIWMPGVGWYLYAEDGFLAPAASDAAYRTDRGFEGRYQSWMVDSVWHQEGVL